jgi:hypothetical protein
MADADGVGVWEGQSYRHLEIHRRRCGICANRQKPAAMPAIYLQADILAGHGNVWQQLSADKVFQVSHRFTIENNSQLLSTRSGIDDCQS